MDLNLIPVVREEVYIRRVRTPEKRVFVLCIASKGKEIIPSEDTSRLIMLCDGRHTVGEIVSSFQEISGEDPSSIASQVEEILQNLLEKEAIQFCDLPTSREIPAEVELVHPLEEVNMEITNACNLNCIHCYNNAGQKTDDELSLEETFRVIDEMKRLAVARITLSGGEPLVHPHFLEIAQYIKDHHFEVGLFTNGTFVTRAVARALKELSFLKVSVSVDSLNPDIHDHFRGKKGAWRKTMEGIRNLKAENVTIKPAIAMTRLNLEEVVDMCAFFLKEGFGECQLMPVFTTGRKVPFNFGISPEEYGKVLRDVILLEKEYKTKSRLTGKKKLLNCGVGTFSLVIKSNGDVIPCPAFGRNALLGNVRDQSLNYLWNESDLLDRLRHLDAQDHPVCSVCELLWNSSVPSLLIAVPVKYQRN